MLANSDPRTEEIISLKKITITKVLEGLAPRGDAAQYFQAPFCRYFTFCVQQRFEVH